MAVVSSREFATHQKKYYDMAVNEDLVIKRGRNRFHLICANVDSSDFSEIPFAHQELVRKRIEHAKTDPEGWLEWTEAKRLL